ncbi:YfbU family protein [Pseudomonas aeruginosa]|uniref:YfbU family protein n=1 Tax=Pseudomonas aeruginosa TaxID=287 RepID=UPI0021A38127|nr:YfbU family protein [Pseudomonas aeruginosa]MCT2413387.1 YfbU family protein [Pseudomonas aeruginosa]
MKITDGEKLIILMLSELYEKLEIDGELDPEFLKTAIFNEQTWGISWKYPGIPFAREETPEIVKEILDILDMWSQIEHGYEELSDSEKLKLKENVGIFGDNPTFRGFDGNNESDYLGTALFIINDLERFEAFKGRSLNSHAPSLDIYRRMLPTFSKITDKNGYETLSLSELTLILSEMKHPDYR